MLVFLMLQPMSVGFLLSLHSCARLRPSGPLSFTPPAQEFDRPLFEGCGGDWRCGGFVTHLPMASGQDEAYPSLPPPLTRAAYPAGEVRCFLKIS